MYTVSMTRSTLKLVGLGFAVMAYLLWRYVFRSYPVETFATTVTAETVLCTNAGACVQQLYFPDHKGRQRNVSTSRQPWLVVGDPLTVLRQQDATQRARSRLRHGPRYHYWLPADLKY